MNRYFIKKAVTACMLVAVLIVGFVMNMQSSFTEIKKSISLDLNDKKDIRTLISNVESIIDERAYGKYVGIEAYGYMQRLLGKNEENDFEVIKDRSGSLHFSYFGNGAKDTSSLVEKMEFYKNSLTNKETKLLYVATPDKVLPGITQFESGLPNHYANETLDGFLEGLTKAGIDSIDYRKTITNSGIDTAELFFRTDHHWTIQTAFWAYKELVNELSSDYGMNVPNLDFYTELKNYNVVTYEDSFIGSLGRKTGVPYSGIDDFSLIYPKFDTDYTFTATLGDSVIRTEGIFEESLLNLACLRYNDTKYGLEGDRYSTYVYGTQGTVHIKNNKIADGPKILLVKDSFMAPVAAFLSTVCSDVYLVDPRYYEDNIVDYTNSIKDLDYVLVSFTPQNLTEEFFRFE